MNIEVRVFMKFRDYLPPTASDGKVMMSLREGSTFADLLSELGIPLAEPKLVVVNGISQGVSDTVNELKLNDGDIVAVFPPAGGG
ncbi:MAG: MoaD/ThiS family protein [bacterium]